MTRVSATAGNQAASPPRLAGEPDADRLLTTAQVADRLQLTIAMVRTAIRDGRLKASLPAGRKHGYRVTPAALDEWLRDSTVVPDRAA